MTAQSSAEALASARRHAATSVMARQAAEVLAAQLWQLTEDPRVSAALHRLAEELAHVPGVDRRSSSAS